MDTPRLIYTSAIASSIVVVFITSITIVAELVVPIKDWLKSLSGHHWTSKSIIAVLLYVLIVIILYPLNKYVTDKRVNTTLWIAVATTVFGSLALFIFFTGHHLGWY